MAMLSPFLIFCLLGAASGRPPGPADPAVKPPSRLPLPPIHAQDPTAPHTEPSSPQGQFLHLDPVNPIQENLPFILQVPQLHTLLEDQQTQMPPLFGFLPLPPAFPSQPGAAGVPFFPMTQTTGPLADTDVQAPVYTLVIQQPLASGSVSSEEGGVQQPMIYGRVLMAMIPGGQNMGIKNGETPDEDAPNPEGLLPSPGNTDAVDPALQENGPVVQGTPISSETAREPLAAVRQEAVGATHAKTSAPCGKEMAPSAGSKVTPSPKTRQAASWLPIRVKAAPWSKGQNNSTASMAEKGSARTPLKPTHRGDAI